LKHSQKKSTFKEKLLKHY